MIGEFFDELYNNCIETALNKMNCAFLHSITLTGFYEIT